MHLRLGVPFETRLNSRSILWFTIFFAHKIQNVVFSLQAQESLLRKMKLYLSAVVAILAVSNTEAKLKKHGNSKFFLQKYSRKSLFANLRHHFPMFCVQISLYSCVNFNLSRIHGNT